jgi:hypothetical protein
VPGRVQSRACGGSLASRYVAPVGSVTVHGVFFRFGGARSNASHATKPLRHSSGH